METTEFRNHTSSTQLRITRMNIVEEVGGLRRSRLKWLDP